MVKVTTQQIQGDFENDFSQKDKVLLQPVVVSNTFDSQNDIVEGHLYNPAGDLLISNYNISSYAIIDDPSEAINNQAGDLYLNPQQDVEDQGYSTGQVNIRYNFLRNKLGSSQDNFYYISEISQDRTEIRIGSTILSSDEIITSFNTFNEEFQLEGNYTEYYLNLGNNNLSLFTNVLLDNTTLSPTILIKLYEPLPTQYTTSDILWITEQVSNTLEFSVSFEEETPTVLQQVSYLKGPNFNIAVDDQTNNTTDYLDYSTLISTPVSTSFQEISSILDEKGISINVDYTDYNNFVHFSSAKERILNFYYKVSLIEAYNNEIDALNAVTGSATGSALFTGSIIDNQNKRDNIIAKFDGYEKFLYFTSGSSKTWPKQTSTKPYILYPTGSSQVLSWIGSFNPNTISGSGELYSSSIYDTENQDNLVNTIPGYLREDSDNTQYELFLNMVGQQFDNTWIYLKDVTEKFDNQSKLTAGISKDLVAQAIRGLGLKIYTGNFTDSDLFGALLGVTPSGSLLPSTGSEVINTYVTASNSSIPTDDYTKEIYKRIYHNLPLLVKSKGTKRGLRALINTFGIPDTILRIDEFGGVDKLDTTNEYYYNKYALALNTSPTSSHAVFPYSNVVNSTYPYGIEFRVKSAWSASNNSSREETIVSFFNSTLGSNTATLTTSRSLSDTGSYTNMIFEMDAQPYSASIPFYNQGWWNILITGSQDNWDIYIKNEIEGNLGQQYSGSAISSTNFEGNVDYVILGNSGSTDTQLDGYYQEFRYWKQLSEEDFNYHVLNPQSYESAISTSLAGNLLYRNDLGTQLTSYTSSLLDLSPLNLYPTGAILLNSGQGTTSYSEQEEIYYMHNPSAGIGTRVSDKIRITDTDTVSGSTLSYYSSITKQDPYRTQDLPYVEVAFSPQNQINDDIIDQLGFFNIDEYIGDPRQRYSSSYDDLNVLRDEYFSKYTQNYNLTDFIRLIKYYDNTLFKMIKDYVPARASLSTGVVIKPHHLERSKVPQVQLSYTQPEYTGSIDTAFISGSTGGVMPNLPGTSSIDLFVPIVQSYTQSFNTPEGIVLKIDSTQDEFYNGELPGSIITATTQSLLNNPYNPATFEEISYTANKFLNPSAGTDTEPAAGEVSVIRRTVVIESGGAKVDVDTVTELIFNIIDGNGNNLSQVINNATSITITYSNGTATYQVTGVSQPYSNSISLFVTQTPFTFNPNNGAVTVIFEPYSSINTPFYNSVYNPTINNAVELRKSSNYYDLDYNQNYRIPINYTTVVTASQLDEKPTNLEDLLANVQDSNYTLRRHIYPRYEGSQLYGARLNIFTPQRNSGLGNYYNKRTKTAYFEDDLNRPTTYIGSWKGDKSVGRDPVINHNNTLIYYCEGFGGTDPELRDWSTFFINSAYIITNDEATDYIRIEKNDNFFLNPATENFQIDNQIEITPIDNNTQNSFKDIYQVQNYGMTPEVGNSYFMFKQGDNNHQESPFTYSTSNKMGARHYINIGSGSSDISTANVFETNWIQVSGTIAYDFVKKITITSTTESNGNDDYNQPVISDVTSSIPSSTTGSFTLHLLQLNGSPDPTILQDGYYISLLDNGVVNTPSLTGSNISFPPENYLKSIIPNTNSTSSIDFYDSISQISYIKFGGSDIPTAVEDFLNLPINNTQPQLLPASIYISPPVQYPGETRYSTTKTEYINLSSPTTSSTNQEIDFRNSFSFPFGLGNTLADILPHEQSGYYTTYGNNNYNTSLQGGGNDFDPQPIRIGSWIATIQKDIDNGIHYYINFDRGNPDKPGTGYVAFPGAKGLAKRDTVKVKGISRLEVEGTGSGKPLRSLIPINEPPLSTSETFQYVIEIDRPLQTNYTGSGTTSSDRTGNNDMRLFRAKEGVGYVMLDMNRRTDAPGGSFRVLLFPENTSNSIKSNIRNFINKEFGNGENLGNNLGITQ